MVRWAPCRRWSGRALSGAGGQGLRRLGHRPHPSPHRRHPPRRTPGHPPRPGYQGGDYEGHGPTHGVALAREIGTVFYRSREEFNQRFRWQPIAEPTRGGAVFDVQSYLRHQGQKILGDFDANSYLTLSLAMDLFDVWRGFPSREAALEPVEAEFMIVGVDEDRLIPMDEQEWLHHALVTAGKRSHWRPIENHIGHDWFSGGDRPDHGAGARTTQVGQTKINPRVGRPGVEEVKKKLTVSYGVACVEGFRSRPTESPGPAAC